MPVYVKMLTKKPQYYVLLNSKMGFKEYLKQYLTIPTYKKIIFSKISKIKFMLKITSCKYEKKFDLIYFGTNKLFFDIEKKEIIQHSNKNKIIKIIHNYQKIKNLINIPKMIENKNNMIRWKYILGNLPTIKTFNQKLLFKIFDQLNKIYSQFEEGTKVLSHGDLNFNNIIIKKRKIFFIDFENLSYKEYGFDIVNLLIYPAIISKKYIEYSKNYIEEIRKEININKNNIKTIKHELIKKYPNKEKIIKSILK